MPLRHPVKTKRSQSLLWPTSAQSDSLNQPRLDALNDALAAYRSRPGARLDTIQAWEHFSTNADIEA
jgi:hypothetical protein